MNIFIASGLVAFAASLVQAAVARRFTAQLAGLWLAFAAVASFVAQPPGFPAVLIAATIAGLVWFLAVPRRRNPLTLLALMVGFLSASATGRVAALLASLDMNVAFAGPLMALGAVVCGTASGGATAGALAWVGAALGLGLLTVTGPVSGLALVALPFIAALDLRHSKLALAALAVFSTLIPAGLLL